jgi:hypothetical protein
MTGVVSCCFQSSVFPFQTGPSVTASLLVPFSFKRVCRTLTCFCPPFVWFAFVIDPCSIAAYQYFLEVHPIHQAATLILLQSQLYPQVQRQWLFQSSLKLCFCQFDRTEIRSARRFSNQLCHKVKALRHTCQGCPWQPILRQTQGKFPSSLTIRLQFHSSSLTAC